MLDCDDVFSFRTAKTVLVRDRFLGLLSLFFYVCIVAYLVVTVIIDRAYLSIDPPVGVSRMTVHIPDLPKLEAEYPYCTQGAAGAVPGNRMDCAVWDTARLGVPSVMGQLFITTRVTLDVLEYSCTVQNFTCQREAWNTAKAGGGNYPAREREFDGFIYGVDEATVWVDHGFESEQVGRRLDEMAGKWLDCHGNVVKEFPRRPAGKTRLDMILSQLVTVRELVSWARPGLKGTCPDTPMTLDELSLTDPVNEPDNTLRYDGLFLWLLIEYDNTRHTGWSKLDEVEYVVKVIAVREADPKYVTLERDGGLYYRTNRHGVNVVVTQIGRLGRFSLSKLVIGLTAGLGLLAIAGTITSFLARWVMPLRAEYEKLMVEKSVDFSDYRKLRDQAKEGTLSRPPTPDLPPLGNAELEALPLHETPPAVPLRRAAAPDGLRAQLSPGGGHARPAAHPAHLARRPSLLVNTSSERFPRQAAGARASIPPPARPSPTRREVDYSEYSL